MSFTANAKSLEDFDKLWNYNKPAETETKFRELLPKAKESGDLDYYLQLRTQLVRTQSLQRKFEQAHEMLDQIETELSPKTPIAQIRYHLERGRTFNSAKEEAKALPEFIKAFDLGVVHKQDNFAVDAAHMIAIAEKDPKKQMEWNLRAVDLAEESKDEKARGWLASLYNNIGIIYQNTGEFKKALEVFKNALALREKKGEASSIRVAKWMVAHAYRLLKKYDEALKMQLALEKELDAAKEKDGYVYEELAELYKIQNNLSSAKKYAALGYNELSKDEWFKVNEPKRLENLKTTAGIK